MLWCNWRANRSCAGALALGLVAILAAGPAKACVDKRHFTTEARYQLVCDLEKTLPFEVGSSRVWDDHLAFFDKSQPIRKGTRYRTGLVFTESGQPFKTEARSRKIAKKIGRLSACKLISHDFQPGKPSRVEYACKLAN